MHSKTVAIFVFAALFFCSFSIFGVIETRGAGTTLYVGGSGPENYSSIQAAIDIANPGDEIYVYSGTYSETIIITKNVTLAGQNKDTTIIDGGKTGHVLRGTGSEDTDITLYISGFTIRNAGGTGNDCIALSYANGGSITNNIILSSDSSDGIQLDMCVGITIADNTIGNNEGNGIYVIQSVGITVDTNLIQNNQIGIRIYSSSTNNVISNNQIAGNSQYGIQVLQSLNNRIYRNDFTNNGQHAQDAYTNDWSYTSQGNYWDDYTGRDSDHDGIGDIPYDIPGGSNQDLYPLGYFISENQKPVATILTINPTTAAYGTSIYFSGMGADPDGSIIDYNWRSSINGQLSTNPSFSTSSLSSGSHIIYFRVQDNDGEWSIEKTASITVLPPPNQKPTATISSINPPRASYGQLVYFMGYGLDDGSITAYTWTSSLDGVISTQNVFSSSHLSVGNHTIYFQVMDNEGVWSDYAIASLEIISSSSSSNKPSIANTGGPYTGVVNSSITFDGSNSSDPDGTISNYYWEFGDDSTGTGIKVNHTYTEVGNYTVILRVTDNNGTSSTNSTTATILLSLPDQHDGNGSEPSGDDLFAFPFTIATAIIIAVGAFLAVLALFFLWFKRSS
jgi:parallel beta-helix repeat protein